MSSPGRQILLTLPSLSALGTITLAGFEPGSGYVAHKAVVNLKRSTGYTVGGGLKVVRPGAFNPKSIWTVKALISSESQAANYREMVIQQQYSPYLGAVVLTDTNDVVNASESAWNTRSVVTDSGYSGYTVGGITRNEIACNVFLETLSDNDDIIRPVGIGAWAVEFIAIEV